jgi:quercetin dioxygenase-like cupin family protein
MVERVEKPWGYELVVAQTKHYLGKIIHINRGHSLSLQYHREKDESIYVYSGTVLFEVEEKGQMKRREMKAGDSYHIKPRVKHRMTAAEDTDILEISTPHPDDVVRLKDKYGRI